MPPKDLVPKGPDWIARKVSDIERQLAEVRAARRAESATIGRGGLVIQDGGTLTIRNPDTGLSIFNAGPNADASRYFVSHYRDDGTPMLASRYVTTPAAHQMLSWTDGAGNIIVMDDEAGVGLALPNLAVPMYPRFIPQAPIAGDAPNYWRIDGTDIATEQTIFDGRVGHLRSPLVEVHGLWGRASGTGTVTYKLYYSEVEVGSWTGGDAPGNQTPAGPFDISTYIGSATWHTIRVTAQTASGAGNCWAHLLGVILRGT